MDCRFHALKFFYCRRILFSCRFLAVETHEVNSDKYERNTEPLPHIQRHCLFKIHLVFFQELDEEAEDEYLRQAETEEVTGNWEENTTRCREATAAGDSTNPTTSATT